MKSYDNVFSVNINGIKKIIAVTDHFLYTFKGKEIIFISKGFTLMENDMYWDNGCDTILGDTITFQVEDIIEKLDMKIPIDDNGIPLNYI